MPDQKKRDFDQLETGYEFPDFAFELEPSAVARYVQSVEDSSPVYQETRFVPPSAIAAFAQASLLESMELVAGTIHASQELEFLGTVDIGDTITTRARVSRKQERRKMRILNIDLDVHDSSGRVVMKGRNSFILPPA